MHQFAEVLAIATPRMVEAYIRAIANIDVDSFGEIHWAVWRRNLDGSETRHCLSNASEDTCLETLPCVGVSLWRIETEFETEKSDVGWASTRPAPGLDGTTTSPCAWLPEHSC